ncbi:MAG: hypothetical protein HOM01_09330 [Kordiimonadaceae bacterium]|nr:hypothetical protein [Kordiimonadaceae bacterium]
MIKRIVHNELSAMIMGTLSALVVTCSALAEDKIRQNPNYLQPDSNNNSYKIIMETLESDFDQFLNIPTETGSTQYIQLTDPTNADGSILSLNTAHKEKKPLLRVNQEYSYNPSLSFNIPSSSLSFGNDNKNIAGSQMVFSLSSSDSLANRLNKNKSFRVLLGSSYLQSNVGDYTGLLNKNLKAQKSYNLNFGIGYSGFHLGGSYSQNDYLFSSDLSGFDLGFGYMSDKWSADLRVGEYNRKQSLLFSSDYNLYDNVSAYELGGALRLFPNVSLTGRFTYYSYGQQGEIIPLADVKTFIFGTNLSF